MNADFRGAELDDILRVRRAGFHREAETMVGKGRVQEARRIRILIKPANPPASRAVTV